MANNSTSVPVKNEQKAKSGATALTGRPFDSFRREVDRLFEDFDRGLWTFPFRRAFHDIEPYWRSGTSLDVSPSVDVVEKDEAFNVIAEVPGLDERDLQVSLVNGGLSIKGEKREDKEEKRKDYHLQERRFGAFERFFALPDGIDADKIEATFKNGVLSVTIPKKPEAIKAEKKIEIKPAS